MGGRQGDAQPRGDRASSRDRPPQRAARNSVWPEKGTPASLMIPLCTGPVTRASKTPGQAAIAGDPEGLEHDRRALALSSCPGRDGAQTVVPGGSARVPARCGAGAALGVPVGPGSGAAPGRRRAVARQLRVRHRHQLACMVGLRQAHTEVWANPGGLPGGHGRGAGLCGLSTGSGPCRCRCGPRHRPRRAAGAATGPWPPRALRWRMASLAF